MAAPTLQWSSAEVSGGVLTIPVDGDRPKGWRDKFQQVVTLLGGGPGGEVSCKSGAVRVTEIADGDEESLHHFLESVLQETNAAFASDDDQGESDDAGEEESDEPAADDADARLTETFRKFAG